MDQTDDCVQPSTADVLAEVKRRRAARRPQSAERRGLVILADRFIFWLSKHWLAIFNGLALLYVGLPILAPVLMYLGFARAGGIIHTLYKPLCHQLPQRSFFLFGPQLTYTLAELSERVGPSVMPSPWSGAFTGNEAVGYKVAFCQRDVAIYGMIFLAGVIYGLLRRRREVRPLSWWGYVLLGLVPMGIDGGYQWLSYVFNYLFPSFPLGTHETTPLLRVITGSLFGLATVWMAYPYVQETMDEFRQTLHEKFGWE